MSNRPLPANPSFEFEKKEAKAFLRQLRAGDSAAVSRAEVSHPEAGRTRRGDWRLADAQVIIAREYGFASWPKLAGYFAAAHRQQADQAIAVFNGWPPERLVRALLSGHGQRVAWAGRALAAYAPRFYGMPLAAVYDTPPTEAEARQAAARLQGAASWQALTEAGPRRSRHWEQDHPWRAHPQRRVSAAMRAGDLSALDAVCLEHPEFLDDSGTGTTYDGCRPDEVCRIALQLERNLGAEALSATMRWIESRGLDLQAALDRELIGHHGMSADKVRWLLERGANPDWVSPGGVPVLEYALIRYWNGAAVDVLAARARAKDALWVAAGLGSVDGVRRHLDRRGRPRPGAGRHRPPFDVGGAGMMPLHPEPDDEELLLEALVVAVLNGRGEVIEYLGARGVDVNTLSWDQPVLAVAAGNGWVSSVDALLQAGADPDIRGRHPNQNARELARELFLGRPDDANLRAVVELLGDDPARLVGERPAQVVELGTSTRQALTLAATDARNQGAEALGAEHLLFGILQGAPWVRSMLCGPGSLDGERFEADFRRRLSADAGERSDEVLISAEVRELIQRATVLAEQKHRSSVEPSHLLQALLEEPAGKAAALLARYGADIVALTRAVEQAG